MISTLAVVLAAWGALAFGAVYPWAYWPVIVGAAAAGSLGLVIGRGKGSGVPLGLAAWLAGLAGVVLLQLVPLPAGVLAAVSPATEAFLRGYSLAYVAAQDAWHALSIRPARTWLGLAFLTSFGLFLLGLTRSLSQTGAHRLAAAIVVLGLVVAMVGIVQGPAFGRRIYGFWEPQFGRYPFGPFVNRNHFAGWMLMALSLSLGVFCGRVAQGMRGVRPALRDRILWFSTPEANKTVLAGLAVLIMGLSLVLAMSRSGVACLALVLAVTAWFIARRQAGSRRAVAGAYLSFLVLVAVAWGSVDALAQRFATVGWWGPDSRGAAWSDALGIIRDFPLTGTGLNTYGTATVLYQSPQMTRHFIEAHNDYLQLAAEGGLLLGIPIAGVLWTFVRLVRRRFRERVDDTAGYWLRAGACIGLVAIAVQAVVEFSLQMPGNAVFFTVLAAIAIHQPPPRAASSHVSHHSAQSCVTSAPFNFLHPSRPVVRSETAGVKDALF